MLKSFLDVCSGSTAPSKLSSLSLGYLHKEFVPTCALHCRRYTGAEGVYTHTVAYERDAACLECSPAAPLEVPHDATLQQVGPPCPACATYCCQVLH